VFEAGRRVFRVIRKPALDDYEFIRTSNAVRALVERGWLVDFTEVDPGIVEVRDADAIAVVEHPRLEFISHPYEWSFALMRSAALRHVDLHLALLDAAGTLSDASAYNIQFVGPNPVFIDLLSVRRYRDGEFWAGHKQFCEQFLNPLLLRAYFDIPHNAWYRGALEGIPTEDLARLLPMRKRLSIRTMSHVVLPSMAHRGAEKRLPSEMQHLRERTLPLRSFRSMLLQLRQWIDGLRPRNTNRSVWADYERTHTYDTNEQRAKREFVAEFVAAVKPGVLWDLGCNTGDYSQLALESGCRYVVGFDFDKNAIDAAYRRADERRLAFLPLFLDAANPSPDQGWRNAERLGLSSRNGADALLALAFEHHLAIGRNVPLAQVVEWIAGLAPTGVIEWVEKSDSTIGRMLALREDIFDRYTLPVFEAELARCARIVKSAVVSDEGRRLYWYDRRS
jgi:ribosomal protein L11 methylase PrmA